MYSFPGILNTVQAPLFSHLKGENTEAQKRGGKQPGMRLVAQFGSGADWIRRLTSDQAPPPAEVCGSETGRTPGSGWLDLAPGPVSCRVKAPVPALGAPRRRRWVWRSVLVLDHDVFLREREIRFRSLLPVQITSPPRGKQEQKHYPSSQRGNWAQKSCGAAQGHSQGATSWTCTGCGPGPRLSWLRECGEDGNPLLTQALSWRAQAGV